MKKTVILIILIILFFFIETETNSITGEREVFGKGVAACPAAASL